jgi:hypothetical protein
MLYSTSNDGSPPAPTPPSATCAARPIPTSNTPIPRSSPFSFAGRWSAPVPPLPLLDPSLPSPLITSARHQPPPLAGAMWAAHEWHHWVIIFHRIRPPLIRGPSDLGPPPSDPASPPLRETRGSMVAVTGPAWARPGRCWSPPLVHAVMLVAPVHDVVSPTPLFTRHHACFGHHWVRASNVRRRTLVLLIPYV